jgi:hypothetical protein
MRIFQLSPGQDTGGQAIRFKEAFERLTPHSMTCMRASDTYMDYPQDLPWSWPRAQDLYDAADVVHLHNHLAPLARLDHGEGKRILLQQHGTIFRTGHVEIAKAARDLGIPIVVSTLDLLPLEPDLQWLPAPHDIKALAAIRKANYRPGDTIRIGHAPTDRLIKSTDKVISAVASLAKAGLPVELVLIENRNWTDCLALKATCDLFVDQLILGYGNNAIEAWGMGIPVICGVVDSDVRDLMFETWGGLPFVEATPKTLRAELAALVRDPDLRAQWGKRGKAHVRKYHDYPAVVRTLVGMYEALEPIVIVDGGIQYNHRSTPRMRRRLRRQQRQRLAQKWGAA